MKEPACHEPVTSKWVKAHRGRSTERFCGVVVLATHQAVQRTQAHGETEPGHELLCVYVRVIVCVRAVPVALARRHQSMRPSLLDYYGFW